MRGYVEAMIGGLRTETVYPIPPIDVFDLTPQKIKLQNSCVSAAEQGAYDMTAAEPTLRANQAKDYEVLHKSVFEMLRPAV